MKYWSMILALVVVVVLALEGFFCLVDNKKAEASIGYTDLVLNDSSGHTYISSTSEGGYWKDEIEKDDAVSGGLSSPYLHAFCGWNAFDDSGHYQIKSSASCFDISSLPEGAQVMSVTINGTCMAKVTYGEAYYGNEYFSWVQTLDSDMNGVLDMSDMHSWVIHNTKKTRLSAPVKWTSISEGNVCTWNLPDETLSLTKKYDDKVFFHFMDEYMYQEIAPVSESSWESGLGMNISFEDVKLIIRYITEPESPQAEGDSYVPFEYLTNNVTSDYITGDEVASNITLDTLSCMYGNEDLEFCVIGDSGANISLSLCDSAGVILESQNEQVRMGGKYYWRVAALSSDYSGFVRAKENNFNLVSPWVSVQPSVSQSQQSMLTYAGSTDYPQYSSEFSSYVVNKNNLMYVHWKTNLDMSTDNGTCDLMLYRNGVTNIYDKTFEQLRSYFKGTETNQGIGMGWRYMVFMPLISSGINTYGSLVTGLDSEMNSVNKGFIQAVIKESSTEIVNCHSAFWYLDKADEYVTISLKSSKVEIKQPIYVEVSIPDACQADVYLNRCIISVVDNTNVGSDTLESGDNELSMSGISQVGTYMVRTTLYSTLSSYVYIRDISVSIVAVGQGGSVEEESNGGGIFDALKKWMVDNGLWNTGGKLIVVLLFMIIIAVVNWAAASDKRVLLITETLTFAVGMVWGFIDINIMIFLAILVVGVMWNLIAKGVSASGARR